MAQRLFRLIACTKKVRESNPGSYYYTKGQNVLEKSSLYNDHLWTEQNLETMLSRV